MLSNKIQSFANENLLNKALFNKFIQSTKINITNIILSGGKSPMGFYKLLAKQNVDWLNYKITLSDERDVNSDHKLSNEGIIKSVINNDEFNNSFISLRDINAEQKLNNINKYQFCLLGMGMDGHFASIFPEMNNLNDAYNLSDSLISIPNGFPDVPRISMTLNEINKADEIILLVKDKAKIDLIFSNRVITETLPIDKLLSMCLDKLVIFSLD
tara:strand:+ start:2041 stop:2682 length:642 start_codon:yes stop_codon:yes gene_type:complete